MRKQVIKRRIISDILFIVLVICAAIFFLIKKAYFMLLIPIVFLPMGLIFLNKHLRDYKKLGRLLRSLFIRGDRTNDYEEGGTDICNISYGGETLHMIYFDFFEKLHRRLN